MFDTVEVKAEEPAKKRKKPEGEDEDLEKLKAEARPLCSDAQEWGKIAKFKKPKLESWVRDAKFQLDRRTANEVTSKVVSLGGMILDRALNGEGYVQEALCEDRELVTALQVEAYPVVKLLNNKMRIFFLAVGDIMRGLGRRPKSHAFVEPEEEKSDAGLPVPESSSSETELRDPLQQEAREVPPLTDPTVLDQCSSREAGLGENVQARQSSEP